MGATPTIPPDIHWDTPSDEWWHWTSTYFGQIHDKVFFYRFGSSDYADVKKLTTMLTAKYTEALRLHEYEHTRGRVTTSELNTVKKWHTEGLELISDIRSKFRMLHVSSRMDIPDVELDSNRKELAHALAAAREHARDNYTFTRDVESRA